MLLSSDCNIVDHLRTKRPTKNETKRKEGRCEGIEREKEREMGKS